MATPHSCHPPPHWPIYYKRQGLFTLTKTSLIDLVSVNEIMCILKNPCSLCPLSPDPPGAVLCLARDTKSGGAAHYAHAMSPPAQHIHVSNFSPCPSPEVAFALARQQNRISHEPASQPFFLVKLCLPPRAFSSLADVAHSSCLMASSRFGGGALLNNASYSPHCRPPKLAMVAHQIRHEPPLQLLRNWKMCFPPSLLFLPPSSSHSFEYLQKIYFPAYAI